MDIRLDKETFKALASGTRVDVLKLLNQRRHMQSEIASSLGLSVPTVKEHLSALEKAGLVERHDEGRKWKYYSLTKKGKGVLNPEEMKIWIVLVVLVFSVIGGYWSTLKSAVPEAGAELQSFAMEAAPKLAMMADVAPAPEPVNHWPVVFGVAAVVCVVLLIYFIIKQSLYKRQLGSSLTKK